MPSHRVALALSSLLALSSVPLLAKAPAATPATPGCASIPLAAPDAGAVREASAANAWGGPRQPGAATLSDA